MRKQQDKFAVPPHSMPASGLENPYLTAFPGKDSVLDLMSLQSFLPKGYINWWLTQHLTGGQAEPLKIRTDDQLHKKLWHIYLESANSQQHLAANTLHLGYPTILIRQQGNLVAAPVFLWAMQLSPDPYDTGTWWLQEHPGRPAVLNPFTTDFANALFPHALRGLTGESLADTLLQRVIPRPGEVTQIEPFPSDFPDVVNRMAWSGLLGIFPDPRRLFLEASPWPFLPSPGHAGIPPVSLSHHLISPEQQAAFRLRHQHRISLIFGGPGTGKSHFVAHTVVDALLHGQKVLVVTDSRVSADRLQMELDALGLNGLGLFFRNPFDDGPFLSTLMRQLTSRQKSPIVFDRQSFQRDYDHCAHIQQSCAEAIEAARRPRFNGAHWSQLVACYLSASQANGRELLRDQLDVEYFSISMEEYHSLCQSLAVAQPLYEAIGTLHHPLNAIQDRIFLTFDRTKASSFLRKQLDENLSACSVLQHSYILLLNRYAEALQQDYDRHYQQLRGMVQQLEADLKAGERLFGDDFLLTSNFSIRLYRGLSGRVRKVAEMREEIRSQYRRLVAALELENRMPYRFPEGLDTRSMRTLWTVLDDFKEALAQWKTDVQAEVIQYKKQFSSKQSHPQLLWQDEAARLEHKLSLCLEKLNTDQLLAAPQQCREETLDQQLKFLSNLLQHLDHLQLSLRDFDAYYHWRSCWLQQKEAGRLLLEAMVNIKASDWRATFTGWYYDQLLKREVEEQLPDQRFMPPQYLSVLAALREKLPTKISFSQEVKRNEVAQDWRRRQRMLHQLWFGKGNEGEDLSKPFRPELGQVITDMIPVFICPSATARSQFDQTPDNLFDLVLVEGGQFIDAKTGTEITRLGRSCVILGDDGFCVDDHKNDLLEAGVATGLPQTRLQTIYRAFPSHPIQMGQSHWFVPGLVWSARIGWQEVLGTYHEPSRTNESESNALIRYLLDMRHKWLHHPPQMGIIAGTKEQRNAIAKALFEHKRKPSEDRDWIQQLERNGLSVLALDELEDNRFDLVLCSLTYGPTGARSITRHLGVFNTPKGVRQLYAFFGTPVRQLVVFNSISGHDISRLAEQPEAKGTYLLSLFFGLARSVAADNQREKVRWIQKARMFSSPLPRHQDADFLREIGKRLQPYLGDERVRYFENPGPERWPLTILPGRQSRWKYWLIPDGILADGRDTNPEWELEERKRLLEKGILTVDVWSVRWWRNEEEEARRVASHLFNLDQEAYGTRSGTEF